jgi:hypothetical protein
MGGGGRNCAGPMPLPAASQARARRRHACPRSPASSASRPTDRAGVRGKPDRSRRVARCCLSGEPAIGSDMWWVLGAGSKRRAPRARVNRQGGGRSAGSARPCRNVSPRVTVARRRAVPIVGVVVSHHADTAPPAGRCRADHSCAYRCRICSFPREIADTSAVRAAQWSEHWAAVVARLRAR